MAYWEDAEGYWYNEDEQGNWSSGNPDGSTCQGDKAGSWSCSDGQAGGPGSKPPNRKPPANSDFWMIAGIGGLLVIIALAAAKGK